MVRNITSPVVDYFFTKDHAYRQVSSMSSRYCLSWNPSYFTPLCYAPLLTFVFYKNIIPFIPVLFFITSPHAVVCIIPFVIIYSFYSKSLRAIPHIFVKVFKSFPSFTNSNSSTAPLTIPIIPTVGAPGHHASPFEINIFTVHPMRFFSCGSFFFMKASTGSSFFCGQIAKVKSFYSSAVTHSRNISETFIISVVCYYKKSAKFLSNIVFHPTGCNTIQLVGSM